MRRWYWSAAAVLALTATTAQADFLVIRVYIGGRSEAPGGTGAGGGASAGGTPGIWARMSLRSFSNLVFIVAKSS